MVGINTLIYSITYNIPGKQKMANRPVFIPQNSGETLVLKTGVEFQYFSGFSLSQKQKCIDSLHTAIQEKFGISHILEVSSKSRHQLGIDLSAFNLMMRDKTRDKHFSVECAFQGSKVFEQGGPFIDLLEASSRDAKRDIRLKESGSLQKFVFEGEAWPLMPRTAFYDWLYITALLQHPQLVSQLALYQAFTDIEFNPEKSLNCQAHALALFMALQQRGLLDAIKNKDNFLQTCQRFLP